MVALTWIGTKYLPGGHSVFTGLINSFVHVIMYFYYYLTSVDSKYKQSFFKKYITILQMVRKNTFPCRREVNDHKLFYIFRFNLVWWPFIGSSFIYHLIVDSLNSLPSLCSPKMPSYLFFSLIFSEKHTQISLSRQK